MSVSSSGVTGWNSLPSYPQPVGLQSCVSYDGFAYCVGGSYDAVGDDLATSYFAPLTGPRTGSWNETRPYPIPIDSQACVASSGYLYCVAGNNESAGTNATAVSTNSDWFASLSSSGIGPWKHTTAYPGTVFYPTCAASASYIYCVGGLNSNNAGVNNVYYAPLSSSGIGQWFQTTAYPLGAYGQVCAIDAGSIICVGGVPNGTTSASNGVYSAQIIPSSGVIGPWHKGADYPVGVETACVAAIGNLYCVGGYRDSSDISDATYYSPVESLLP